MTGGGRAIRAARTIAQGKRSGPALRPGSPASFRQFFKIKSLSVLVKRACRPQPVSDLPGVPPEPLSCSALPCVLPPPTPRAASPPRLVSLFPAARAHRGFARTSIHVLRLMTDSCRPKKVCKSVVERPRASGRVKRAKKKEEKRKRGKKTDGRGVGAGERGRSVGSADESRE